MPIARLADADAVAAFVSSYVDYRPLPQPYMLPDSVQPPEQTLELRVGNTLEMALLLCSLLLGQGFDALVVIGYAPADVVQNVQTSQQCPSPAVKRRRGIQRMVQEFLASCSGALTDVAVGPQPGAAAEAMPAAEMPPEQQQDPQPEPEAASDRAGAGAAGSQAVEPTAAAAAAAEAAGAEASLAAEAGAMKNSDAAGGEQGDAATEAALPGGADNAQQQDGVNLKPLADSAAAQHNGGAAPDTACPYRLHAWILLLGQQASVILQLNPPVKSMHCASAHPASSYSFDCIPTRCAACLQVFIDPVCGSSWSIGSCPFLGIESCFNTSNHWASAQCAAILYRDVLRHIGLQFLHCS